MGKERIDRLLTHRGLAESRAKAQAMIMAGVVLVDDRRVEKSSELVDDAAVIRIKGASPASKYASRAGLKLERALKDFHIRLDGYVCLDVGSSTGGFTDCMLQFGARKVVAVDAGTNQLIWRLRNDPRVEVRENTNARFLTPELFDEQFDLAVIDVSFISLTQILPAIVPLLSANGRIIALIKPQFEVGRGEVGKGGVVREPEKHAKVVERIVAAAMELGLAPGGTIESPILGAAGNKEFLALFNRTAYKDMSGNSDLLEGEDYYFDSGLMVLTEKFLRKRGYCCGNRCRHCPYGYVNVPL